jgi:hypothetical protein
VSANRQEALQTDARFRMNEARIAFQRLTADKRREFDRWRLAGALDSERRMIADAAFSSIASTDERFNHDQVVSAWIAEHERGDAPGA